MPGSETWKATLGCQNRGGDGDGGPPVLDVSTRAKADVETGHYPQSNASAGPLTHHGWLAQAQGCEDAVGGAAARQRAAAQSGVRQRAAAAAGAVEVTR